jgi:hypothetical protein
MSKTWLIALFFGFACAPSSAQPAASLAEASKSPKGIADLFLSCPFLGVDDAKSADGLPNEYYGYIAYDRDGGFGTDEQFQAKKAFLEGDFPSLAGAKPAATAIIVDERNGYLSVVSGDHDRDLVLVYYKHVDGTLLPAFKYSDNTGPGEDVTWGFFDLMASGWQRIPDESILPKDWATAFFPSGLSAKDRDFLLINGWYIDLPRYGTTAHLSPIRLESDLDDPRHVLEVPGTTRTVTLGDYYAWFQKNMQVGEKLKSLELKWNKAQAHFDSGQVAAR